MLSPSEVTNRLRDAGPAIHWRNDALELLDQRFLPIENRCVVCRDALQTADAIRDMVVRGAPAIGIAAAYGMALSAREHDDLPAGPRREALLQDRRRLAAARPTAVNAVNLLSRFASLIEAAGPSAGFAALARRIHAEDIGINRRMARLGSGRIEPASRVLTHCNTGTLATGGVGTAFGVIASAWRAGRLDRIGFTETRPWLQGARLNAWEFSRAGMPATLMTESAAAEMARSGDVDWLITGADRIAMNGDVANKIGTAPLAALTRMGGGRVMVVAPFATVDPLLQSGDDVAIEQRDADEVWSLARGGTLPAGISVANPVFDVTPAGHVDCLITERGTISPANGQSPTIGGQHTAC